MSRHSSVLLSICSTSCLLFQTGIQHCWKFAQSHPTVTEHDKRKAVLLSPSVHRGTARNSIHKLTLPLLKSQQGRRHWPVTLQVRVEVMPELTIHLHNLFSSPTKQQQPYEDIWQLGLLLMKGSKSIPHDFYFQKTAPTGIHHHLAYHIPRGTD